MYTAAEVDDMIPYPDDFDTYYGDANGGIESANGAPSMQRIKRSFDEEAEEEEEIRDSEELLNENSLNWEWQRSYGLVEDHSEVANARSITSPPRFLSACEHPGDIFSAIFPYHLWEAIAEATEANRQSRYLGDTVSTNRNDLKYRKEKVCD